MNDETFDYESHKDWAERVEPRPDYPPSRNPMLGVIAALAGVAGLIAAVAGVFVLTGVLR
ncbi:MAG: hypothetical protein JWP32_2882 [Schumannella sp.]|nr:hypothetical protein [Schumannella sp.]